jgi:hypothetical protein
MIWFTLRKAYTPKKNMEMVILGCWNISNKRDRKKIKNERASI